MWLRSNRSKTNLGIIILNNLTSKPNFYLRSGFGGWWVGEVRADSSSPNPSPPPISMWCNSSIGLVFKRLEEALNERLNVGITLQSFLPTPHLLPTTSILSITGLGEKETMVQTPRQPPDDNDVTTDVTLVWWGGVGRSGEEVGRRRGGAKGNNNGSWRWWRLRC